MNDLPSAIRHSSLPTYVDDSADQVLSSELNILYSLVKTNKLVLSISKTVLYLVLFINWHVILN